MSDRLGEQKPLSTEEHEQAIDAFLNKKPAVCNTEGKPLAADHREINPLTGQQKEYAALCPTERAKGFVRPVRRTYLHLKCKTTTTMALALAETYARDPKFYSGTFCVTCRDHFPLDQFVWDPDGSPLGS